ncbi:SHOCT domain-containing protein [Kitasatospora sp. NPDC057015]|uniref:SHOCT domain-containing protein n=1 Tax=Kitasatospora sp. NPDC057015 TaxID=3346001 RepID=UPI003627E0DA
MRYHHYHDMNGWGFGLMALGMLLFLGLSVVVAVALIRYLGRLPRQGAPGGVPAPPPSPEQLLAERFARGEIDADEYRHRLDTLVQTRPRSGPGGPASG